MSRTCPRVGVCVCVCVCLCVTHDGKHVVSGSDDNTVRVWSLDSGECLHTLTGHTQKVNRVNVREASDGKYAVVSGSSDKTVRVWSLDSGEFIRFGNQSDLVESASDGHTKAFEDGNSVVVSSTTSALTRTLHLFGSPVFSFRDCECASALLSSKNRRLVQQLGGKGLE